MKVGEYEVLEDRRYTKDHEWVKVEGQLARVGITDYASKQMRDIVYVELPVVGANVEKLKEPRTKSMELAVLESIKAVAEIYAPLSGMVKEVNEALKDRPELIGTDPYGDGWICVIEPSKLQDELKNLMDANAYAELLKGLK